jgi:DNA-binding transcriptional LysR family regulator
MNILLSRQFRYFVKVMETRCLNQAAEELCITRSPLGKIISELERRCGEALFIRKYNELIPTPAALALYRRLKPVYDILATLENEFDKKQAHPTLDIIFDMSVPVVFCHHFAGMLKAEEVTASCRRIDVAAEDVSSLMMNPGAVLISYRTHMLPASTLSMVMPPEGLLMNIPAGLDDQDMLDPEIMGRLPLLRKKDRFSGEGFSGYLQHLLKSRYPELNFQETDDELATMMYRVAAGKALVLMPERMARAFAFPGIRKCQVPDVEISLTVHYHKKLAGSASLKAFLDIIAR